VCTYRQVLACTEWQVGSSVWPPRTAPGLAGEFPWNENKLLTAHIQKPLRTNNYSLHEISRDTCL
jgi:hypothetical protein